MIKDRITQLRDLGGFIGVPILVFDVDTRKIIFANTSMEDLCGHEARSLEKMKIDELFVDRDKTKSILKLLKTQKKVNECEAYIYRASGRKLVTALEFAVSEDHNQRVAVTTIHDISSNKLKEKENSALEKQVFQSHKLAELGEMAASTAHELNNPLTVILMSAEDLATSLSNYSVSSDDNKSLERIIHNVDKMKHIISSMKRMSRETKSEICSTRIEVVIEDLIEVINKRLEYANFGLKVLGSWNIKLDCDAVQLEQVLFNLIKNAEDAMVEAEITGDITMTIVQNAHGVTKITVANPGPPIPKRIKEKIFNPFYTTKSASDGTGLGLAICKQIMINHGGDIAVSSLESEGTVFSLRFPKGNLASIARDIDLKILLVDNNTEFRDPQVKFLKEIGCQVASCSSGVKALEALETDKFDLIFTDLDMPEMSGEDFIGEANLRGFNQKFVVISGYLDDQKSSSLMAKSNVIEVLEKPVTRAKILEILKSFDTKDCKVA